MIESSEPRMRLRDIGPLAIEIDGVDSPIPGAKPTRILAMLLVNANRRVSIDALLDAVWGDKVTDSSVATLETHIWRLRKLLEPQRTRGAEPTYLVNESSGYRLIVNPDNADSLRFPQLAEQGDRLLASGDPERALQRYELALSLWRGRPFEPVADEEWAVPSIVRLEERYGQLNEQWVEALLRTGAPERAITELEELIARLPYRERLWSQLMLARYQAGRVEEALDTYHRARTVLLDTMGVDPGAELTALQQRILEQDPTLAPKRPSPAIQLTPSSHEIHLPSRLSELIGRETELERLTQLMRRSRLVTLVGTAGCGKTRLAIEVARGASSLAPDGVWFIDLAAVEDPAAIVDVVMSTIGLERPPVGTSLTALRSYVRDRQVLLLVDNCEHVLPGVFQLLDAVLGDDSQCRVLATSREPVGLDGEVLWTLAPLAVRGDPASTEDEPSAAAQLFLARIQSADPMFEPTPETVAEIEAICAAVDGIPLAIELAAGRLRSATMAEVRKQVTSELGGLGRMGYARTEHHRTVQLSIDWSVRLLPASERAVHSRLSALPGLFTMEAAQAVAGAPPIAPDDVPCLLHQLVHRSLLAVSPGDRADQPTRFRQLATVRAHATHALAETKETGDTRDRRRAFVRELIAARPPLESEDTTGWYRRADQNHDTLAAVLQDCLHDRPEAFGVQLVGELGTYWLYCQRMAEGMRWAEAALEQTAAPSGYRAVVEVTLAYLLALRDRTDLVLPLVRGALDHSGDARMDRHTFTSGLVAAAWCTWMRGDTVLDFVDGEVRPLAVDDPVIGVWADVLEAKTTLMTEGPVAAGIRVDEVLDRALKVGNIQAAWMAGWLDVVCAVFLGDAARGLSRLREVAAYQRRLGGTLTVDVVEFEGCFAALTGDYEQAAQQFGRASALAFRAGTPWPLSPTTEPLLAQVRRELPTARFEAAWQAGEATTG